MNPLNDPAVVYLRALLSDRLHRLRAADEDERSLGASAIEWAIITAILVGVAVAIGAVVKGRIDKEVSNIK
ncbi:hypothetical protein DZF91_11195 [Actinomadura logoneensis]|uniref:Uncharacterized protein n=1 Tax=Actinomadura logoneensis TaxID=2293572 RepID=A0A372JP29_9ACTN|nr:hypothetical protein [Actinomadura logoneensis]RFU41556.1 hypothetical protein DZF91_11195 [Actinomadura logoneensis]